MPYIDLKCTNCSHTFKQSVERCEELYKHDLCKSTDFTTLEDGEIAVQKAKIEALIEYAKSKKDKIFFNQALINSLEDLKK